jgi:hypothetical protein
VFAFLITASLLAWGVYCLRIGRIPGKPYTRREDPVFFWFYMVVYLGASLTSLILLCWLAA